MRGFSKAIITGNLTRDPEMRVTPNGANVASFSVAVNRTFKDNSGESKESVSFIDCVAWGKAAEIISQYAKKGTGILVSGRLEQRSWEDKNSGQKRSRTEVVVEDFNFMGDSGSRGGSAVNEAVSASDVANENIPEVSEDDSIDLSEVPF